MPAANHYPPSRKDRLWIGSHKKISSITQPTRTRPSRCKSDRERRAIGWEIGLLGRQASGEKWIEGTLRFLTSIERTDGLTSLGGTDTARVHPPRCAKLLRAFADLASSAPLGGRAGCTAALAEELASDLPFENGVAGRSDLSYQKGFSWSEA